ncbi:glutamate--tRNA ligase, chloroplastic/mitochondrial-like isoform X2 [Coffea eugenioides]|uniref:glutamate--tRNA ligase, chloroplastic/mitochondrial-like isoform X2 n=1 Tax=Coffea eugenioides TaxID=49369 RepID=UPI000F60E696|nr:glutamate--tRNA ligase, chloroplastic/mitochondrial-like isoform X2 [Coffea eugenioides]
MASLAGTGTPLLRARVIPLQEIAVLPIPMLRSSFYLLYNYNKDISSGKKNCGYPGNGRLTRRCLSISAAHAGSPPGDSQVRVRFAPSPTGNLHVGGARTALFNYLFARSKGGKFIIRIEDTDLDRSTKESEEAVLRDLSWLGLGWEEGPGVGGNYGPYRQSERNSLYKHYAEKLLQSGHVYRCFCSNEVSWNLDTLGDFVIMRSNGQPVYNFCVTVDDASMAISHVIRAEEHLPNTLRQALIYKALGFSMPYFAHVSLILAPDRSKLSKRHGATSVGQFREMGYLPQAMVNYLALLGWGDGSENEFFTLEQLVQKFTIERVNKSGAIFDVTKLRWMNGLHLRSLPTGEVIKLIGERWKSNGILTESEGLIVEEAFHLLKDGIDLITDSDKVLSSLLSYPLYATLTSAECKSVIDDGLPDVAASLLAAFDGGELLGALEEGQSGWQKWVKSFGKSLKRKGKSLFMPLRVLLTGKLHGPDMGSTVLLLYKAGKFGAVASQVEFLTLDQRFNLLREIEWTSFQRDQPVLQSATGVP